MKYYLMNSEGKEVSFDMTSSKHQSSDFSVSFEIQGAEEGNKKYFVKSIAGSNFVSQDKLSWAKMTKVRHTRPIVNVSESLKVYRGFKPSGLSAGRAGELVTDMPGKVIKLYVSEGDEVKSGQTLLILEAMKMENEIKAGVNGVVKTIHIKEGQAIESGTLMIEIES